MPSLASSGVSPFNPGLRGELMSQPLFMIKKSFKTFSSFKTNTGRTHF